MSRTLSFLLCVCLVIPLSFQCYAGKSEINDDFFLKYLKQDKFSIDTSAAAIVLYEKDSYDFMVEPYPIHTVRRIIKILNKAGEKYADVSIILPGSLYGYYHIHNLKGSTYNVDNGQLIRQRVDEENIGDQQSDILKQVKFSMPSVKDGSIIDYTYEIESSAVSLTWAIQEEIPKLYSEFEIVLDRRDNIATETQRTPFFLKIDNTSITDSTLPDAYAFGENLFIKGEDASTKRWIRKNILAFVEEPVISSIDNYRERMTLHALGVHILGVDFNFLDNWFKVNSALISNLNFYRQATSWHITIKNKAIEIARSDMDELSIAKKIFSFVRDSINCDGYESMYSSKNLGKVLEEKSGSVADVNFLLISMLQDAGLKCSPMIISTRSNGLPNRKFPDYLKYNYTVCQLRIGNDKYYLDASGKYNPFGAMQPECYNGYARVIDKHDTAGIIMTPDMAKEKSFYMMTTTNNSLTDYTLNFKFYYGDQSAYTCREKWNKDTAEIKKYVMNFVKEFPMDATLKSFSVQNLQNPDGQLTLDFNISIIWPDTTSMIYLSPYLIKIHNDNPFKSNQRMYPIDMPFTQNITYLCKLQLPPGYVVDEMPKSSIVKIDDKVQYKNLSTYDKDANLITVDSRYQMQRVSFDRSEYDMVKEFYQKTIDEQQKMIVIKKK